jgi:hypothetical protein
MRKDLASSGRAFRLAQSPSALRNNARSNCRDAQEFCHRFKFPNRATGVGKSYIGQQLFARDAAINAPGCDWMEAGWVECRASRRSHFLSEPNPGHGRRHTFLKSPQIEAPFVRITGNPKCAARIAARVTV